MNEINEFKEPELYDLFNADCYEDVLWYINYCKDYTSILELGIGTGRIAIPLAQNNHIVWGVDNSTDMLNFLRVKIKSLHINSIHIIEQDICNLKISHKFDIAIVPFCTFNFLLSDEEQKNALTSLNECLTSNAIAIFDLITPQTFLLHNNSTNNFTFYKSFYENRRKIDIYVKNKFDTKSQILEQIRLFKIYDNKEYAKEKKIKMINRIISLNEFDYLLKSCGFIIHKVYGNFCNDSFNDKSQNLIIIAQKV